MAATSSAAELTIDCSRISGTLKPLHGVNSGTLSDGGLTDISPFYRELGIPLVRLHDCHWPNPDVVDIHVVFPDFRADPARPESYDFARTDEYLQAIAASGCGIVYRLGESIEHTQRKRYVRPPADADRWAEVCLGIIRHYHEGWAAGPRLKIRHWEVWNEPENRPAMWTGSDQDYFRLYNAAAKAIKARFPDLRVGGPAVGYSGRFDGDRFEPSPFVLAFLENCRREKAALDFFSWHIYTDDPHAVARHARAIRSLLDAQGFAATESHLNEWNYLPGNQWLAMSPAGQGPARQRWYEEMAGSKGASFAAATLLLLENSPVDAANFYRGDLGGFGLFNHHAVPNKTFYAFKAFKTLLDSPSRLSIQGPLPPGVAACAGTNDDRSLTTVLVSNYGEADQAIRLTWSNLSRPGPWDYEVLAVDGRHDFEPIPSGRTDQQPPWLDLKAGPFSVLAVRLTTSSRSRPGAPGREPAR